MMEGFRLTSNMVEDVVRDCLFRKGESTDGNISVNGIGIDLGLHPGRVASHKDEIVMMLNQLPRLFREGDGGGGSFLEARRDKHGTQWGEHRTMDVLFMLGAAIGRVDYLLPREYWKLLPGRMPYMIIRNGDEDAEDAT